MAWRGRGGRSVAPPAEYRSYDDYDDAYPPISCGSRVNHQKYGDRGQCIYAPLQSSRHPFSSYEDGPKGWNEPRSSRGPYSTINHHQQGNIPQAQQQESLNRGAYTERGTRWSAAPIRYPSGDSGRPPSSGTNNSTGGTSLPRFSSSGSGSISAGCAGGSVGGGGERQPYTGRFISGGSNSGSAGVRYNSNGREERGRPPAGVTVAIAALRAAVNDRSAGGDTPLSNQVRAPYLTSVALADQPAEEAATEPEDCRPSNPHFISPVFPQPPRTQTDSCNSWALMVEAGSQALEAVVGPFLEGALMELFAESWERELLNLEKPLPPFNTATCAELVTRCKQLHERLPITIHKRVEAVAQATHALASNPCSVGPEDVMTAHTVMKGMLQDCIKAMKMPSLFGGGSRQFHTFIKELLPHAESTLLYYDMLIADCAEAAAARQQARAGVVTEVTASRGSVAAGEPVTAAAVTRVV